MSSTSVETIILDELRTLQKSVNKLSMDTSERLSTLEARLVPDAETRIRALEEQTKPLFDNGQPGRCTNHETRISSQENWRGYVTGVIMGVTTVAAGIASIVTWVFKTILKG